MLRSRTIALLLVCLGVCPLYPYARSGDMPPDAQRNYTQRPEVVASQVAGQPEADRPASAASLSAGPTPLWIWGADDNRRYVLRTTFTGPAKNARLKASCDNLMTLFVNGQRVGTGDTWQSPVEIDVTPHMREGENTLTAEVENQGGPAAFVLKLALTRPDDTVEYVVSDATWRAADAPDSTDDAPVRVIGKLGIPPWGDVFSGAPLAGPPRDVFFTPPGFQVERLFTVPKEELGSWVCLTSDDKGRLLASDQEGRGLCRITPPSIGSSEPTQVEHLDVNISAAQGMLYAFDSLYLSVNGGPGSGLYRARDTNGDDQFDEVVKLKEFRGGGEHGPHALRLSPDGRSIFVICGNHTAPPADVLRDSPPQTMAGARPGPLRAQLPAGLASRIAPNWDEDLLLPRQWDGNGHAAGILAPGGWIARTDPEGKDWEITSIGYRNPYDMAFNADGELFAYDADMEWDFGTPWYRPTRVVHATGGSEFGWRSGTGKWPPYYPDSLPQLVDIGPGSPVGVEFGYGTRFPARFQRALYLCDWTFGTMYAIHIEPAGASYRAVREEFLSRTPLPLTDATVGRDGALYFTVGGRGTQSELYRVTYVGSDPTEPAELHDLEGAELRGLRHKIEALQNPAADASSVGFLLGHIGHADRFIRYAARVALERQPVEWWQDAVLESADVQTLITGAIGLARQGGPEIQGRLLAALDRLDIGKFDEADRLALLRAYQLALIRLGPIDDDTRQRLTGKFDGLFPSGSDLIDRELATLSVALQSPTAAERLVPYLTRERAVVAGDADALAARNPGYGGAVLSVQNNPPDLQQMHYAFVLRNLKQGWETPLRQTYFEWFAKARQWSGGASYMNFLKHIDEEAFDNCTDSERLAIEALGARQAYVAPELPKPAGPGRAWVLADVLSIAPDGLKRGRNFENGKRTYAAARCVVCHRFGGDGGATGPDLTQLAGRFNLKDLTEAMTDPSKVISDQYRASVIVTTDGVAHTGRIVSENDAGITLVTDPENSTKVVRIARSDIDERQPSAVSLMPKDLLNALNQDELLDLLAYLLSRGNPGDSMYQQ